MYELALTVHSLLRWVVILSGVWAVFASASAAARRSWTPDAARPGLLFTVALDIQFVVGLLIYLVLSPLTRAALVDIGGTMGNSTARFWAIEHPLLMIAAVVLAHVGRMTASRAGSYRAGGRARLWFTLALLAVLLATPWPFSGTPRPWIRLP